MELEYLQGLEIKAFSKCQKKERINTGKGEKLPEIKEKRVGLQRWGLRGEGVAEKKKLAGLKIFLLFFYSPSYFTPII